MTNDHEQSLEEWWKAGMPPKATAAEKQYFKEWWKTHRPQILQRSLIEFREAYSRHETSKHETGKRAAYIDAIRALSGILMYLEEPFGLSDGDPALMWFVELALHLEDIDAGIIPPLFLSPRKKGLSTVQWMARERVVSAVELIHAATDMKYALAARRVIRGYKLPGVSEKEVDSWRKEFQKGRVPREARELYDDNMAWLREMTRKKNVEALQRDAERLFETTQTFVCGILSREVLDQQIKAALLRTPKPPPLGE
jgi:hypothetical protein